ncbi:MAG: hypothetical protein V8T86_03205 [Victivallis sp.]
MNLLFGLAGFPNGVTAEFELNERLPDTMPDTCFLKANFTHGHVTNQPIVGHFNEEGMLFATDRELRREIPENVEGPFPDGPVSSCFGVSASRRARSGSARRIRRRPPEQTDKRRFEMKKIRMMIAGMANPHVPLYLRGAGRNIEALDIVAVSDFDAVRLGQASEILAAAPESAITMITGPCSKRTRRPTRS